MIHTLEFDSFQKMYFLLLKATAEDGDRSRRDADKKSERKSARKSEKSDKKSKGDGVCYQRCHDKGVLPTYAQLSKCIKG